MREVSMFQLQELVRLHRMGSECREVARLLGISPNTERKYRLALLAAGVLSGSPGELPSEAELLVAIEGQLGSGDRTPQLSTVAPWLCRIEEWSDSGAGPQAIFDRLCRDHEDFTGSLSAVKRACSAFRRKRGVSPEDVAIPVVTEPGHIAQVDFGYVGKLFDPATMVMRKAWVFVMTLGHSRYSYQEIVVWRGGSLRARPGYWWVHRWDRRLRRVPPSASQALRICAWPKAASPRLWGACWCPA